MPKKRPASYYREYRNKNKEKCQKARVKRYPQINELRQKAYNANSELREKTKARNRRNGKRRRLRLRIFAIHHYSNGECKCACCGEKDLRFLQIDHIDENGAEHRRTLGGKSKVASHQILSWLEKNGYPDGYQILCANCNIAKSIYGICPHYSGHPNVEGLTPEEVLELYVDLLLNPKGPHPPEHSSKNNHPEEEATHPQQP